MKLCYTCPNNPLLIDFLPPFKKQKICLLGTAALAVAIVYVFLMIAEKIPFTNIYISIFIALCITIWLFHKFEI